MVQRKTISRKPIRPIERQKMRPWLMEQLQINPPIAGLAWLSKRDRTFRISWRHAARQGWNARMDADLFERWARHTGKYHDGDEPDPLRWKANFRCALNSLPDVKERKDAGLRRGQNAFRVYQFLDDKKWKVSNKCAESQKRNCRIRKIRSTQKSKDYTDSDIPYMEDDDVSSMDSPYASSRTYSESSYDSFTSDSESQITCEEFENSEIPNFEKFCDYDLGFTSSVKVEAQVDTSSSYEESTDLIESKENTTNEIAQYFLSNEMLYEQESGTNYDLSDQIQATYYCIPEVAMEEEVQTFSHIQDNCFPARNYQVIYETDAVRTEQISNIQVYASFGDL